MSSTGEFLLDFCANGMLAGMSFRQFPYLMVPLNKGRSRRVMNRSDRSINALYPRKRLSFLPSGMISLENMPVLVYRLKI